MHKPEHSLAESMQRDDSVCCFLHVSCATLCCEVYSVDLPAPADMCSANAAAAYFLAMTSLVLTVAVQHC
jgi:hypothetical protein